MSGLKKLAPIVGTAAGAFFGGPAGASLGGAIGSMIAGPGKVPKMGVAANVGDITKESQFARDQYKPIYQSQMANQGAVSAGQQQALAQQALAATGKGPSLAEMQLRSAQDRGMAQQLAAAQSQRASSPALAQRQLLLNMGNANRDLAQQSAITRLQERDAFLQNARNAQQDATGAVNQDFNFATAPKKGLQEYENAKMAAHNANQAAKAQSDNALQGALLGAAGSMLGQFSSPGAGGAAGGGFNFGSMFGGGAKTPAKSYSASNFNDAIMAAKGGPISGPGTGTSDSIPARLSDGEFVIKAAIVKQPGMLELLQKINAGQLKGKEAAPKSKDPAHFGKVLASRKKDK